VRNTKFGWIRNNTWQNPGAEGDFAIQMGMKYSDPPIDPSLPQPVISNISFINGRCSNGVPQPSRHAVV